MFHRIGDVYLVACNPRFRQGPIQQGSSGPDEGMSRPVFLIARLFADENDRRMARSL